jgi:NTP pyrophosphatase (non-canonical NTP hydrolase)
MTDFLKNFKRILILADSDVKGNEQMCIKLMEEVGELAEVVNHQNGWLPHKTLKESAFGEAADVIQCTLTLLRKLYTDLTHDQVLAQLSEYMDRKSDKWESVMVKKPVEPKPEPIAILHTGGDGLWSVHSREVSIVDLYINYVDSDREFGELRVVFDTDTWNTKEHGLIYTDKKFMKELETFLDSCSLRGSDASYSEQGMQGKNFVSLDIGPDFSDSWELKYPGSISELVQEEE